jgi:hypothetical protein
MKAVWAWIVGAFNYILKFFEDANGKPSSKRLISLALIVVSIRQFIIGDWFGGLLLGAGAIALCIVAAVTKS